MSNPIRIIEVGPRDGLQNQTHTIPLASKRRYIELLLQAGVREFEAGAFVRPDRVPQMAESEKVLEGVELGHARAFFLVANEKGLVRAQAAGVKHIAVFTAATDSFNLKNIGMTRADSLRELAVVIPQARALGMTVRGYLSVVWGCPYEGQVAFQNILETTKRLLELGCFEVSLGDTIGIANPAQVVHILKNLQVEIPLAELAVHFHDTRGMGVANVYAAVSAGIRAVDSASGGLGGCPYAPGATGNVGTEDVIYLLEGLGFATGLDLHGIVAASRFIYGELKQTQFSSKTLQALVATVGKLQ